MTSEPQFRYDVLAERLAAREWFLGRTGGRCCACGVDVTQTSWHAEVEHNHVTGLVRGVCCCSCNSAMWAFDRGRGNARKYPHLVLYAARVGTELESMRESA